MAKKNLEQDLNTEFRLISNLSNGNNVFLEKADMTSIPKPAEIINLKGNPFIVHNVSYAINEETKKDYYYVDVFKAGSFKLKIGGRSY
jgi:hypothetical protein